MIKMPAGASNIATMVGIDPGTNKMGVSVMKFNIETLEIVSITAETVYGIKLVDKKSWMFNLHGELFTKVIKLGDWLRNLFIKERPLLITSEHPYFNPTTPTAFKALVKFITILQEVVHECDEWRELVFVEPNTVKLAVGAKGGVSKNPVRDAVLAMKEQLNYVGDVPLEQLDDNAIDAIAVNFAGFKKYKEDLCLLK